MILFCIYWNCWSSDGLLILLLLFLHTSNICNSPNLSTIPRLNCTVLCCIVLYSTVLYCTVLWTMGPVLTMCSCCQYLWQFLPTPLKVAWVFRWTFSPSPSSPSSPHLKLFVSVRYRKRRGGHVGPWQCMPSCFFFFYQQSCVNTNFKHKHLSFKVVQYNMFQAFEK